MQPPALTSSDIIITRLQFLYPHNIAEFIETSPAGYRHVLRNSYDLGALWLADFLCPGHLFINSKRSSIVAILTQQLSALQCGMRSAEDSHVVVLPAKSYVVIPWKASDNRRVFDSLEECLCHHGVRCLSVLAASSTRVAVRSPTVPLVFCCNLSFSWTSSDLHTFHYCIPDQVAGR